MRSGSVQRLRCRAVLFYDTKTFIAPAITNSFHMQETTRASQWRFHTIVIASVLGTVAISTVALLYLAYEVGADRASGWFFTSLPTKVLDAAQRLGKETSARTGEKLWICYTIGFGWVILSLALRRRVF